MRKAWASLIVFLAGGHGKWRPQVIFSAPRIWLLASLCALVACGGGGGRYGDPEAAEDYIAAQHDDDEAAEEAADEARQAVYEERGADSDGTGADVSTVDAYDVENSENYVCTDDCSGHEAGFDWARDNDIADPSECGGNSDSFIEGCEAFAEDRQRQADQEAQEAAEQAAEEAAENAEEESEPDSE